MEALNKRIRLMPRAGRDSEGDSKNEEAARPGAARPRRPRPQMSDTL